MMSFASIEPILREALSIFGRKTKVVRPEYPFWRLQHDGLSQVIPSSPAAYDLRGGNTDPKKSSLYKNNTMGGLMKKDYELLVGNPVLQSQFFHRILDSHFPLSLHEEIINYFGFRIDGNQANASQVSNSDFKDAVIAEYKFRCAITGFSSNPSVHHAGLEPAELVWRNHGGASMVSNAISMTSLHCKLFHLGLFTIEVDFKLRLSSELGTNRDLGLVDGHSIKLPTRMEAMPTPAGLEWHMRYVFRG